MAHYDAFADEYDDKARHAPQTAFVDRPALLGLLGDVSGARVLDAGCGSGLYAEELLRRGAHVVGLDASDGLLDIARSRWGSERRGGAMTWLIRWTGCPIAVSTTS